MFAHDFIINCNKFSDFSYTLTVNVGYHNTCNRYTKTYYFYLINWR